METGERPSPECPLRLQCMWRLRLYGGAGHGPPSAIPADTRCPASQPTLSPAPFTANRAKSGGQEKPRQPTGTGEGGLRGRERAPPDLSSAPGAEPRQTGQRDQEGGMEVRLSVAPRPARSRLWVPPGTATKRGSPEVKAACLPLCAPTQATCLLRRRVTGCQPGLSLPAAPAGPWPTPCPFLGLSLPFCNKRGDRWTCRPIPTFCGLGPSRA